MRLFLAAALFANGAVPLGHAAEKLSMTERIPIPYRATTFL